MVTAEPPAGGGTWALSVTISTVPKVTAESARTGPTPSGPGRTTELGPAQPADSITTAGLMRSVSVAS